MCLVPVSDGVAFIYFIQPFIYSRYEYTSVYKFMILLTNSLSYGPNHSKTNNITASNNENKPNRLLLLALLVQKRLNVTVLKQFNKKPTLLVVFYLLCQYSSLTHVCLCIFVSVIVCHFLMIWGSGVGEYSTNSDMARERRGQK